MRSVWKPSAGATPRRRGRGDSGSTRRHSHCRPSCRKPWWPGRSRSRAPRLRIDSPRISSERPAALVDVGRVDEVNPDVERAAEQSRGGRCVDPAEAPTVAERHRAEAEFAHEDTGLSERLIVHDGSRRVKACEELRRNNQTTTNPAVRMPGNHDSKRGERVANTMIIAPESQGATTITTIPHHAIMGEKHASRAYCTRGHEWITSVRRKEVACSSKLSQPSPISACLIVAEWKQWSARTDLPSLERGCETQRVEESISWHRICTTASFCDE